jgi:hypothetical protein
MWKSRTIKLALVSLVVLTMLLAGGCFNKPPTITSLTPSATSVARGESCTVNCVASDPDTDDTLTYAWSATGGAVSGTGNSITWAAPTTEGSYSVTVTVSDGEETVTDSCNITVVNSAPVISSFTPSATELPPEGSCTIGCAASDADGDSLTYTWSATGGAITGTSDSVSWEAPAAEGTYTISVEVSDGHGGTASDSCEIVVEMKYGSIDIQSNPASAAVYLNGVDTGNITPYVITGLEPGSYTVMLDYYHYKYRQATVTVAPNETTYINWSLTYATEQTLEIQPDATEGKDAYVNEIDLDENCGDELLLYAGANLMIIQRSYLQFSLDSLPEDAVITSARLGLYYYYNTPVDPTNIGVYPVQEAWTETGITWDNQPASAATPEDTCILPAAAINDFRYWYITDLVKGWWDGSIANYGVMLKSPSEAAYEGWTGFLSSDFMTADERPKLVITYFDPTS